MFHEHTPSSEENLQCPLTKYVSIKSCPEISCAHIRLWGDVIVCLNYKWERESTKSKSQRKQCRPWQTRWEPEGVALNHVERVGGRTCPKLQKEQLKKTFQCHFHSLRYTTNHSRLPQHQRTVIFKYCWRQCPGWIEWDVLFRGFLRAIIWEGCSSGPPTSHTGKPRRREGG